MSHPLANQLVEFDDLIARMQEHDAPDAEVLAVKAARHASAGELLLHELLEQTITAFMRKLAATHERLDEALDKITTLEAEVEGLRDQLAAIAEA